MNERGRVAWIGLAMAAALILGCHKKTGEPVQNERPRPKISIDEPAAAGDRPGAKKDDEKAPTPAVKPEPPPPATIPKVALTATLLETCKVKVGDAMPDDQGKDLRGDKPLRALYGSKLTAILFWTSDNPYSGQALEDLAADVARPYGEKGVAVVGINVKDPPDRAARAIESAGGQAFPNLLDPAGKFFAKVATEKLPRLYLLDAAGKVLWFDLQYSDSTRHDLLTAIQVALGEKR
jgi:hypothetical protein